MLKFVIRLGVVLGILLVPGSFIIAIGAWLYQNSNRQTRDAGAPIVLSEAQRARASKRRNVRLGQLPSAWPFVRNPRISSPPPSRVRRPGL
jgi:hypothetical protein